MTRHTVSSTHHLNTANNKPSHRLKLKTGLAALTLSVSLGLSAFIPATSFAAIPTVDSQGERLPSLAPMLKQVRAAVVNISTSQTQQAYNPLMNDPFFRRFFDNPQRQRKPQQQATSAGSGVIIDAEEGIVITNHHVVSKADKIEVVLNNGRTYEAKLLGNDPEVDIAVLQIKPENLTQIRLADSEQVEIGDFAIAIGNPFGLGQTVTSGVVSAVGRSGLGIDGYENFIQTDASINPGNSGGALVDLSGRLIGINTAIIAPGGGNVGIGFAIPTNMALSSVKQIIEHGEVQRGQLGVYIQDLTPELADAFELKKHQKGVLISKVMSGSAAEKAGIKEGDVVISVNGKATNKSSELRNAIGLKRVNERVKIKLIRNGKQKVIKVTLSGGSGSDKASKLSKKLNGARLDNTQDNSGVAVSHVEPNSEAALSGLRAGDIILAANRIRVTDLTSLKKAIGNSDDKLLLRINRNGAALFLVIR